MEQEHHPSAVFSGLMGRNELIAFRCQLHDYAVFLSRYVKQRKQDKKAIVMDKFHLVDLMDSWAETFHLQCRLLQVALWRYQHGEINHWTVEEILQVFPVVVRGLVEPPTAKTQNILERSHEWIEILDADYPNQVVIAHSISNELTIQDHLMWTSLERRQVPHIRWNWRQLAKNSEKSTPPNLQQDSAS